MAAFTSAESTKIRHYLGYPQVYRQANPRLESAITVVGGDQDAVDLALGLLASITNVLGQIEATALVSAGLKSLDKGDVELYDGNAQTVGMQRIGRTFVAQLSGLFGVPIATDIFSMAGYQGDAWKASNGNTTLAGLG
jgi:hypothetical protein